MALGVQSLQAQLSVSDGFDPDVLTFQVTGMGAAAGAMMVEKSDVFPAGSRSLLITGQIQAETLPLRSFDFTRTAPHLAFFCRLEINDKAGFVIPAKFRLGGHRHWQDNLLR